VSCLTLRIFAPWRLCVNITFFMRDTHAKAPSRKEQPQSKTPPELAEV